MKKTNRAPAFVFVISVATYAYAGPTAHIGKELTKGVTKQVEKEASGFDLQKGARQVAGGVVEGVSDHGRDVDRGASDLGRAIARGFFVELRRQMGADGNGPLATSVASSGQRGSRELVRGVVEGLSPYLPDCQGADRTACIDAFVQRYAYEASKSAAKGAADGAPPWTTLLAVAAGFAGGLVVSGFIGLIIGQGRTRRELAALRPQRA